VLVVLELLVAGGKLSAPTVDEWLQRRIDPVLEGTAKVAPPVTRVVTEPRSGQVLVTGTLTRLLAEHVDAPAIPTPFTIEAAERGVTRAVINGGKVEGQAATISWDGGRPLPITGDGRLELSPAPLTADAGGFTWALEGAARRFAPGSYRCNFTVAVGREGIASPREGGVAFTAGETTLLQVTHGGAFIHQPPAEVTFEAAESAGAILEGTLTARTTEGEAEVGAIRFGPGLYKIHLTPTAGGYQVDALLQGPFEV
jgi:hypothetical protein